jgi:type I restriction enzyme S subunit
MEKIGKYITKYVKGKTPKELYEAPANGLMPYLSPDYLRDKAAPEFYALPTSKTVQVDDGEVIVLWDGSNAGEIFISKKGILASTMVKLDFDETEIHKPYYSYSFQYLEYFLKAKTAGSGIPHADKGVIKRLDFFKPEKDEQKVIASILSKVDAAIRAADNSIKSAEKLKKGLMQNLLTGKLKTDGTLRTDDEFYKHEKFGNCPVGWHWGRLSEIADVIAGQSPSGEYYNEDGIGTAMLNGPTEFTDLHPIPVQYTTKVTKLCAVGDILFTVRGSSTGRMNIADQEYCIGRGIAAIRAKDGCDTDFIYYTLITISEKILAEAKGAGTTFPNVSRGELLKKWVLIPDTDQSEIASKIKSVDAFLKEKQKKVTTIQRLKKSLMQNLLTGKVRVDVNKIEKLLQEQ